MYKRLIFEQNVVLPTFNMRPLSVLTQEHVPVSLVGNGVDVWGHLMTLLATIEVNDLVRVDWVETVRIDHHTEQA